MKGYFLVGQKLSFPVAAIFDFENRERLRRVKAETIPSDLSQFFFSMCKDEY